MKKFIIVLAFLLVIGLVGVVAEVAVSVSGYGKATIGYNLDNNTTGIENDLRCDIKAKFNTEKSAESEGGEGVYGYLKITNIGLTQRFRHSGAYLDDWSDTVNHSLYHWSQDPAWAAKIVAGDLWVRVDGDDSYKIRVRRETLATVLDDFSIIGLSTKGTYTSFSTTGAVSFGYGMDMFSVAVHAGSATGWKDIAGTSDVYGWVDDDDDATTAPVWDVETAAAEGTDADNGYAVNVDLEVKAVENLSFGISAVMGLGYATAQDMGFGTKASYKVALGEAMSVSPYVAFDGKLPGSGGDMVYEVGGGAKVSWPGKAGINWAAYDFFGGDAAFPSSVRYTASGAALGFNYTSDSVMNLMVSACNTGAESLIPGVGLVLLVEAADLTGAVAPMELGVGGFVDYSLDKATPFGWAKYTADSLLMGVGASLDLISNTAMTLKYTSGNLSATTAEKGTITFETKISL